MTTLPPLRHLRDAIAVLEAQGIPYMVIGGFAVRLWGLPRPTYDADLAVQVGDDRLPDLFSALEDAGFDVPVEYRRGFLDRLAGLAKFKATQLDEGRIWDTDFFLARDPLLTSAMQRRKRVELDEGAMEVIAPEDLVLLKLLAYRRKDQLDIEEILLVNRQLDWAHLDRWAARLDVLDRLRGFDHPTHEG